MSVWDCASQDETFIWHPGYGSDTDRARALGASFDEHLVKPVAIDKLMAVLQQLLG